MESLPGKNNHKFICWGEKRPKVQQSFSSLRTLTVDSTFLRAQSRFLPAKFPPDYFLSPVSFFFSSSRSKSENASLGDSVISEQRSLRISTKQQHFLLLPSFLLQCRGEQEGSRDLTQIVEGPKNRSNSTSLSRSPKLEMGEKFPPRFSARQG